MSLSGIPGILVRLAGSICRRRLLFGDQRGDDGMKKKTVKKRIFLSNAKMILAALALILFINLIIVKVYWEFLEREMRTYVETQLDGEELEEVLQDLTM